MSAKLTTKDFIDRASSVHGDKYGYAFSVYSGSKSKLAIHCPDHGFFLKTPNKHLNGQGCPSCSGLTRYNNKSFVKSARLVHGDVYCYNETDYVSSKIKIKIKCKIHGSFNQLPSEHLSGKGCPSCGTSRVSDTNRTSKSKFVTDSISIHGNKYDYSNSNYINTHVKINIYCHSHGNFRQTPNKHLSGQGCPGCAKSGFDRTKVGFLYVLRSDCGQYMKIGITNKPVQRQVQLSRSTPFSFKRIELIEGPGEQIANLEKEMLSCYQPAGFAETFDGSTEWRLWDESIRVRLFYKQ